MVLELNPLAFSHLLCISRLCQITLNPSSQGPSEAFIPGSKTNGDPTARGSVLHPAGWLQVPHTSQVGSHSKVPPRRPHPHLHSPPQDSFQIQFSTPTPLSNSRPNHGSTNNKEAQR